MDNNNYYRHVIQILVILVRICVGLVWASAGPLLPFLMQEYSIGRGEAGWYASIAPIAVAIAALPIGIIGSRFSLKKTFVLGAFMQAAGVFAPFCETYPLILLTRICYALGTAIVVPVAAAILAEWFTARELPMINGLTVSFVSLGNTVAFVATVPLATVISWRAPITIYGAFAATCALAWLIFGRERHYNQKSRPLGGDNQVTAPGLNLKAALLQRSTLMLSLAVMGAWCLGNALGSWLPTYYHEVFGMPLAISSSITAIITLTGILASIAGGILSVKLGRRKPLLIISGSFAGLTALLSVLFNSPVFIFIGVALFGFFANLSNGVIYTIPMELPGVPPRTGAVVFSCMLAAGNFGNFLGPLIVGYTADFTGSYLFGFVICAVLSLTTLLAGIIIPETGPEGRRKMAV